MIFDSNILTTTPADWTIENGSIADGVLTLAANGSATCSISLKTLSKIPDCFLVSFAANKYSDPYAAQTFAIIQATTKEGAQDTYYIPIVDTGNNICTFQVSTTAIEHTELRFTFITTQAITFTDWNLYPPKVSDVDLTEVLDKIPRLLKDYNEDSITIGQAEDTVGMICSYVTADTELTGHFTLDFNASEATTLTMRVYDNEVEELYAPLIFYINAGFGTIGLPHAYLNKLKGYHNFIITAQVASGSITIKTRQVMYVIDGGRLVYSVMDVGSVVSDLTLRKLFTEDNYSYIYAVCIDKGTCIVKKCPYSATPGAAWVADVTIGDAIDATIEFDGYWTSTETPYRFTTEEFPWVAWVSTDNNLHAKKLTDAADTVLATGVLKVHAVKGWDNVYTAGNDQGLLLAYVKTDGKVYYRGYCHQADDSYTWETERQVTAFTGTAVDVNTFRLNDFRIGFDILDSMGTTYTYITGRNYAGMSVKPECLNSGLADPVITVVPIQYIDNNVQDVSLVGSLAEPILEMLPAGYTDSLVTISNAKRVDDYHIRITFNYKLENVVGQQSRFTVENKTVTATAYGATAYDIILTVAEALPSVGMYPVSYTSSFYGVKVSQPTPCSPARLASFSTIAQGDPPVHEAKLAGNLLNPVMTVTYIKYSTAYDKKSASLAGGLCSPSITITHVGVSPL